MTPKDAFEAKLLINTAFKNFNHPYALRFPRGNIKDQEAVLDDLLQDFKFIEVIFVKKFYNYCFFVRLKYCIIILIIGFLSKRYELIF